MFPHQEAPTMKVQKKHALAWAVFLLSVGTAHAHDSSSTRLWTCEIRQQINPSSDGTFKDGNLLGVIANAKREPTFTFDPVSGVLRFSFWSDTYIKFDRVWPGGAGNSLKGLREEGSEIAYLAIETWREPHVAVVINGYQDMYIGTCTQ
jgi:hypothetical protein